MEILTTMSGLIAVSIFCLAYWLRRGKIQGIPEPAGNFLLGNVFQLGGNFCNTFLKWKEALGPVFQLRLANTRVLIFNDKESISKVCSLHQAAGRPRFGFFERITELFGAGLVNSEGGSWEEQRQFYQRSFRTFGFGRVATEQSLLDEIFIKLHEWEKLDGLSFQLEGCSMAYIFNATWWVLGGQKMIPADVLELAQQFKSLPKLDTVGHQLACISVFLAEKFTNAMDEKLRGIRALSSIAKKLVLEHQNDRIPGEPRDVIDDILEKMDMTRNRSSIFHKQHMKSSFAIHEIMYASMDSSSKTLEWLMLYLIQKPEVASKLYAEIDKVLGTDLDFHPGLSERDRMPYTQACILEALRRSSVIPLGAPHKALEEFELDGVVIPRGTVLVMNLYGAHHDPAVWYQPEDFNPERFLIPAADKINVIAKNKILPFGSGRRMCPGSQIALDSMFLFVVHVYRKFRFELVSDPEELKKDTFGLIRYTPKGIRLRAVCRSEI